MLGHSVIAPESAEPDRYMLFLHGILGTRANWRGIARRFVDEREGWGAVLVDLREHGESLGYPAPHTLKAAARDVGALEAALGISVAGAVGHSFGGKVVLEWLRSRAPLETEAWVIDASPSSTTERDQSATTDVLRILGKLPREWSSQDAFVRAVTEEGQPEAIARWLAMNLRRTDDGRRSFGPDLTAIRELIEDYSRTDCWDVVKSPPRNCTIDFVVGGRSSAWSAEDRERLGSVSEVTPQVRMHVIADAGHWVHVDSADALVALLTT
jgi:pimeloyl-ACP methyl ester carboxylesterase